MKKWLISCLLICGTLIIKAQQAAETIAEQPEVRESWFSNETKWTMVYIFTGAIILIVLRTFRNKPEI